MSMLCVATAAALMNWQVSTFTLSWIHSVEKTVWQEAWTIDAAGLTLREARVKGSGAGMDPGDGAQLVDGWWVWQPQVPAIASLLLSASGDTASAWQLCVADECLKLGETEQDPVKLWPCEELYD
jgi:hypothetical protein